MNKLLPLLIILFVQTILNSSPLEEAQKNYDEGRYELAFKQFSSLAKSGDNSAKALIGNMYLFGFGTEKNIEKGLSYIKESAENGNSMAQYILGNTYYVGE
jgi:TPR repeat protein